MGKRYIWYKYAYKYGLPSPQRVYTVAWSKFSSYPNPVTGYKIGDTGKYEIDGAVGGTLTMEVVTGKGSPAWNWFTPYLIAGNGDYLAERVTDGCFWARAGTSYVDQGSASGDVINGNPNDIHTGIGTGVYSRAAFNLYGPAQVVKGEMAGHETSAKSTAHSTGVSGGYYWEEGFGGENIDPVSISYPASSVEAGQSIQIKVGIGTDMNSTLWTDFPWYYVIQQKVNNGSWTQIGTVTRQTSGNIILQESVFNATIPEGARTVQYRAYAKDDSGFVSTAYVTGDTITLNGAPTAPASISLPARVSSEESFTVTWAASTDAEGNLSGYQVERSYNGGSTWTTVSASVNTTSITDRVAAGNKTVMYRVRAFDTEGLYSAWTVSTNSTINTEPTAPASVSLPTVVNCGQEFTVSWTAATDVDNNLAGYQVERSYDEGGTWASVSDSVTGTSIKTTVTDGHDTVMYRVRAYDAGGLYSGWTVSQSKTVNQPPVAPPEITLGTVRYGDYTTLTWAASSDEDGTVVSYTLQRSVNGGDFEPVYSGAKLTFTDKTENWTWKTVQYRVQAVDDLGGLSEWTVSPVRQVQPGRLTLTGSAADLGRVIKSFNFSVTVNASGEFLVSGIQVVITLDGDERLRKTVSSGEEVVLPIDLWGIEAGDHTLVVTASRDKFTQATGTYRFTVVPIELGEGGRLELLENRKGQAVYPVTLMEGIFRRRDGKSLEAILDAGTGGGGSGTQGPQGEPGKGVPTGGAKDQILAKRSGKDYDTQWITLNNVGGGAVDVRATVETLPAGSDATVSVSEEAGYQVFHFGIPQGMDGARGQDGVNGRDGSPGAAGADGADGAPGAKGDPGEGVPAGGTAGQILAKKTAADYDAKWIDLPESGGAGVNSFNGRSGAVAPTEGDYTADMVGARDSTWMPTAEDVGAIPAVIVHKILFLTEPEYESLSVKYSNTLYLIKE